MDETQQPTPAAAGEATTPEEAPPPGDAQAEVAAAQPPEAPAFDLGKALDEAPADLLRKHPKFAGLVGSEKQRWQADWEAQKAAEAQALARTQAEEELRDLARRNPVEFADKWLSSDEVRQQQERLSGLERGAQAEIGRQIGAAMHALPGWTEAAEDPAVLAELAAAIQGKSGGEMLGAWNGAALKVLVARQAAALAASQLEDRLKAERAAWEAEASGRRLGASARPDLARGGRVNAADPEPDFLREQDKWHAWYRRNT